MAHRDTFMPWEVCQLSVKNCPYKARLMKLDCFSSVDQGYQGK